MQKTGSLCSPVLHCSLCGTGTEHRRTQPAGHQWWSLQSAPPSPPPLLQHTGQHVSNLRRCHEAEPQKKKTDAGGCTSADGDRRQAHVFAQSSYKVSQKQTKPKFCITDIYFQKRSFLPPSCNCTTSSVSCLSWLKNNKWTTMSQVEAELNMHISQKY